MLRVIRRLRDPIGERGMPRIAGDLVKNRREPRIARVGLQEARQLAADEWKHHVVHEADRRRRSLDIQQDGAHRCPAFVSSIRYRAFSVRTYRAPSTAAGEAMIEPSS